MGPLPGHVRMRGRFAGAVGLLAATFALATAAAGLSAASAAASGQVITIAATTTGTVLNDSSTGLSFEASDLASPGFTAGNLASYLKTLGTSVMRIGGNTSDETFWTSTGQTPPSWSTATITPAYLTALNTLAKASGWKVILGVNLKQYDPSRAADEAEHAVKALGSSLQAIEIGNEPDLYLSSSDYFTEFQAYVSAIEAAAPGTPIEGSDTSNSPASSFQTAFVDNEASLSDPNIVELTSHYYPLSDCGGSTSTISELLGTAAHNDETSIANEAVTAAGRLGVPAVLDEGNSVVCEGEDGVSNVFASALWEIHDQLLTAREGVSGDYEHGTVVECGSAKPLYMYYTPLCAPTAADAAAGDLAAQPEYYGLAAVHEIGTGDFLDVTNPDSANVHAYAIRHSNGTVAVVLDDFQDPSSNGATSLQLDLPASFGSGDEVDLTASGLSATSGITLGGQTVQSDGDLAAPTETPISVDGDTVTVSIPAGTAELLTFGSSSGGENTTFDGQLSGKCLSVTGGSTADGAAADIYDCNGSPSENWTVESNGTIVGGPSGDCLEVAGGSTANQAGVDIGTCDGAASQQWTVEANNTIVDTQSGKCLSVTGGSTADRAPADIYTCNGSGSETWN
jgi:hypothetical protein